MLQQLWVVAQFTMLMLSVFIGANFPQSSLPVLALLVLGGVILAPLLPLVATICLRTLSLPRNAPTRCQPSTASVHRMLGAPGTPGAALARAPSVLVHTLA